MSVHPRMRGERIRNVWSLTIRSGSSPHARGTQLLAVDVPSSPRFIPACAGNAALSALRRSWAAVHPRMRGERPHLHSGPGWAYGSSPHARGTHSSAAERLPQLRFIPACAGNAPRKKWLNEQDTVHPRMRGERDIFKKPVGEFDGSSPHARGTRRLSVRRQMQPRFIPACAGNASNGDSCFLPPTVHPRMRGERHCGGQCHAGHNGSSPHARGTPFHIAAHNLSLRFIPACAGNACCGCKQDSVNAVHPRMRGERGAKLTTQTRNVGSSPHARGTRIQRN